MGILAPHLTSFHLLPQETQQSKQVLVVAVVVAVVVLVAVVVAVVSVDVVKVLVEVADVLVIGVGGDCFVVCLVGSTKNVKGCRGLTGPTSTQEEGDTVYVRGCAWIGWDGWGSGLHST